jgi:serine protease Do
MSRTNLFSALIALFVTLATIGIYHFLTKDEATTIRIEHLNNSPLAKTAYTIDEEGELVPLDFTKTAEQVMDAVVHIKSTYRADTRSQRPQSRNPFEEFFREGDPFRDFFFREELPNRRPMQPQLRVGQGSGVIISEDGYIVTNNHVIENADDIEVNLHDNRTYKATVVGTDPTTDLALIRIREKELPALPFVNSDEVKVGEWVMAVGNPFNLTSTVTAGIVSAKGRSINILREQFAVESFIQTDAAINPGNSGGALVNLQGGLIGINTAIASPTGAYSGYGFAVPSNIVSKVVEDLMQYGVVQRGVLGVMIRTVDGNLQQEKRLDVNQGAYVDSLLENSAAAAAGIEPGDVIISVDGVATESSARLQELIARRRPGDQVAVTVNREGKEKTFEVVLNNRQGEVALVEKEHKEVLNTLGAELETLSAEKAEELDIPGGVLVKKLYAGPLRQHTQMREGFIITKADGRSIKSVDELADLLEGKQGGVLLEGIYEDQPGEFYYGFGIQ